MRTKTKVAVTIPRDTLASLERVRRRGGQSRSAAVTQAVDQWLRSQEVGVADEAYVRGYLRQPERTEEFAAAAMVRAREWTSHPINVGSCAA